MTGLIKAKDFEKMFEMPIYAQLPYDAKSATLSVNKGQPLVIALPRSEISKGLDLLTEKIIKDN
jgi:Flp pilus assembly CpaE family ATPase